MAIYCTRCGKQCPEGTRFCTSCGNLLTNEKTVQGGKDIPVMPATDSARNQQSNSSNKLWIVIAVLLVLIVLAVIFLVTIGVMSNREDVQWDVATTEEEEPQTEDEMSDRKKEKKESTVTEAIQTEEITTEYVEDVSEQPVDKEVQSNWVYTNARFGYSLLVPAGFSPGAEEPDNGDGAWLYNEDGACLTVSGHYNALPDTPESIVELYSDASYTYVGDNYCCVSFVDGDDIVYIARRVEPDLVYGFEIVYPREDSESYDSAIEDMLDFLLAQ